MKDYSSHLKLIFFFIFFFIVACFLSFNRHSKSIIYTYHSEIFADKAGYYIYLPAFFIYNFQVEKLPEHIEEKTGNGFSIDRNNNKIVTKYTYGVALMQAPFFVMAHLLAKQFGYMDDGFSLIYNKTINIASVFYTTLAFIFLYFFLIRYISNYIALLTLIGLFLGTNIFYYSIFETGMSHIYSFCLFSAFLLLSELIFRPNQKTYINIIFGIVVGLIIVVRPINLIFLPLFFLFNQSNNYRNIKNLFVPVSIIIFSAFIIVIPQLIYWHYLTNNFILYSYYNESFANIMSPKIVHLWFSTNNGLVIYNPLIILILSGIFFMREVHIKLSLLLSIYFVFISYVFASWWSWDYGCSYGSRPFVEYYSLFSLPFGFLIQYATKHKLSFSLISFLIVLFIAWNLKLIFSFDGCWYGGNWDWKAFTQLLVSETK